MSESEATLHDWLMVVGIKDGELIAWEALKREAGPRLEPRCLDASNAPALPRVKARIGSFEGVSTLLVRRVAAE
jgi:hypothetical protein